MTVESEFRVRLHRGAGDVALPNGEHLSDTQVRRPPELVALIDAEELQQRLERRLGEVVTHAQQHGLPTPVARFRGRLLWDESAVDRWLAGS